MAILIICLIIIGLVFFFIAINKGEKQSDDSNNVDTSEFTWEDEETGKVGRYKRTPQGYVIFADIFKEFLNLYNAVLYIKSVRDKKNYDLSALEIINPQVAKTIWLEDKYYVLIEYENDSDWNIKNLDEIKETWAKRDACYAATVNAGYPQIEDPEVHEHVEDLLKWCEDNNIPLYGHIGIWVLHPHFNNKQEELMDEMYKFVQELWWNVSGEHWIWKKKQKYLSDEEKNDIKVLKEKCDPNNIFGF